jgi:hypothetical protein
MIQGLKNTCVSAEKAKEMKAEELAAKVVVGEFVNSGTQKLLDADERR